MKQWRTGTQTIPNNVPPKEIFMYTAWNSKEIKLDMMEMVYYVLLNLYPRWNHVIPRIPFTSKVFEILLKG